MTQGVVYESVTRQLVLLNPHGRPTFRYVSNAPCEHDVQLRIPDVRKAREILGFEATTTLDQMLVEVIPWIRSESEAGRLWSVDLLRGV